MLCVPVVVQLPLLIPVYRLALGAYAGLGFYVDSRRPAVSTTPAFVFHFFSSHKLIVIY